MGPGVTTHATVASRAILRQGTSEERGGGDVSQGLFGESPEISKRERTWWVEFGAGLESRQHLGGNVRGALLKRLREASGLGEKWAFEPCILLGLYDDAWRIQRASVSGPGTTSVLASIVYLERNARMDRELDGYARWLLGHDALHSAPEGVTAVHRREASGTLGHTAVRYPDTLRLLIDEVHRPCRIDRGDAIVSLGCAVQGGHQAGLDTLVRIARDPDDEDRESAIFALDYAAGMGHRAVLDALAAIALDRTDRYRQSAIFALGWAVRRRHGAALDTLVKIALDPDEDDREAAISALGEAIGAGHGAALDTLVKIALDPDEDDREAAISALGEAIGAGHGAALDTLVKIALDQRDPCRNDAIVQLGWAFVLGWDIVQKTLWEIALHPDGRSVEEAIDLLAFAIGYRTVAEELLAEFEHRYWGNLRKLQLPVENPRQVLLTDLASTGPGWVEEP